MVLATQILQIAFDIALTVLLIISIEENRHSHNDQMMAQMVHAGWIDAEVKTIIADGESEDTED